MDGTPNNAAFDLETPVEDAREQRQEVVWVTEDGQDPLDGDLPVDADSRDALEQRQEVAWAAEEEDAR